MDRGRHCAVRTCVGCGRREEQRRLLRFAVRENGSIEIGRGGGRGAYVHERRACVSALDKSRLLSRSLKRSVDRDARRALIGGLETLLEQGRPN